MWRSQPPPWGPCWSLHTEAAPVSPVQPSSSGRCLIQSHPLSIWHQLHCICISLPVSVPHSPRFLAGVCEVVLCHGQPGTMLVSAGSPGCSRRCSLCCNCSNKHFALSLSQQCHLILFPLLHLLHPQGLYAASGVPPQPAALPWHLNTPQATFVTAKSFEAGGAIWGRDSRAAPC